eukprot:11162585-Lingulodinium_polyedra.AAC.1
MGFPCKDVSTLNTKQWEHRDAMTAGRMEDAEKTGKVFVMGVCAYVSQHAANLRACILENVPG